MENLTKEMGLVGKLEEPRPKPGYTLVVFREVDGGHELVDTLPDGARFRPGLLAGLGKRFRARAVTTDPALRDHFDVRLSAVGGSESVHVNLTVHLIYSIVSPATVAMRVDKDPLRRLRKEIEAVLESEALKVDRKDAENKAFDLEGALLHLREFQRKASDGRGNLDRFRSFAQSLGFDLQTLEIVRTPTAEELDEAKGLEKQERVRRELAQTEITKRFEANETEETKRVRIGAARPTRLMEVDADKDVESLRADRDFSIHAVKRVTYLMDQGVERLNEALKTIAHNTDSARSLRETMRELVGLRQELGAGMLQAADGGGPGGRFLAAEAPPQALPGLSDHIAPPDGGPLFEEIGTMYTVLAGLDCRPSERSELAARVLHLLAELSRGERADPERLAEDSRALQEYRDSIAFGTIVRDVDQHDYFKRLQDLDRMKRAFGVSQAAADVPADRPANGSGEVAETEQETTDG